jgi:N-acetylmuramoyl-L-alanine amidase
VGKILISIHFDKGASTNSGPFVVINRVGTGTSQAHHDKSRQLGTNICNRLLTTRFGAGSGKTCYVDSAGDWTVLREVKDTIPAVIIEVLNFNNTSDMNWLGTGSTRDAKLDQLAQAIYQGIRDYYNAT